MLKSLVAEGQLGCSLAVLSRHAGGFTVTVTPSSRCPWLSGRSSSAMEGTKRNQSHNYSPLTSQTKHPIFKATVNTQLKEWSRSHTNNRLNTNFSGQHVTSEPCL